MTLLSGVPSLPDPAFVRRALLAMLDHCGGNRRKRAERPGVRLNALCNRLTPCRQGEVRAAAQ
jgi:hypothetical protein